MSERKLRVGVFNIEPDAYNCFKNLPKEDCNTPGIEMEIFQLIMTLLGLDYELVDIVQEYGMDKDYGSQEADGTWSGLIGLLMNGTIDLTALTIRLTPERAQVIDFSFPVRFYQTVYIMKGPDALDFRNFIFSAFTTEVWVYFVLTVCVACAVHFVCVFLLLPRTYSRSYRAQYAFNMMMDEHERYWCCSLLTKIYFFGTLVMSEYYQSVMTTNLTSPSRTKMPFLTQAELIDVLEEGKYHLSYYFDESPPCYTDADCERLNEALKKNPIVTFPTEGALMDDLRFNSGIYFGSEDMDFLPAVVSHYNNTNNENLTEIRDTSLPMSYVSFAFSKRNKRLRQRFTNALVTVFPGIGQIKTRPCYEMEKDPEDATIRAESNTLTLGQHLKQLFEWWAIGIGGTLVYFFVELFWFYHTRLTAMRWR